MQHPPAALFGKGIKIVQGCRTDGGPRRVSGCTALPVSRLHPVATEAQHPAAEVAAEVQQAGVIGAKVRLGERVLFVTQAEEIRRNRHPGFVRSNRDLHVRGGNFRAERRQRGEQQTGGAEEACWRDHVGSEPGAHFRLLRLLSTLIDVLLPAHEAILVRIHPVEALACGLGVRLPAHELLAA